MKFFSLLKALVPIGLAIGAIILLEGWMTANFEPEFNKTTSTLRVKPAPVAAPVVKPRIEVLRYKIVLVPSRGGKEEPRGDTIGDGWSPTLGRFTIPYLGGPGLKLEDGSVVTASEVSLKLAKKVQAILEMTRSDKTWPEFEKLVQEFSGSKDEVQRVVVESVLSREHGWQEHPNANEPNVNRFFRLFDSPVSFPPPPDEPLHPGLLSWTNAQAANMVVSLNFSASSTRMRGMKTYLAAPHAIMEHLRQIKLEKAKIGDIRRTVYFQSWAVYSGDRQNAMLADAARYFFGYIPWSTKRSSFELDAPSRDQIQWAFRDDAGKSVPASIESTPTGLFWDRERSRFETWRREKGQEGEGGDNYYASQELIRFVRYGLWKDHLGLKGTDPEVYQKAAESMVAKAREEKPPEEKPPEGAEAPPPQTVIPQPDEVLGRHLLPFCSNYVEPINTNSVYAHLELGHLTSPEDRQMILGREDVYARSLAVGIYALVAGRTVQALPLLSAPQGQRIEWEKYYRGVVGAQNYFELALPPGHPRAAPLAAIQRSLKGGGASPAGGSADSRVADEGLGARSQTVQATAPPSAGVD